MKTLCGLLRTHTVALVLLALTSAASAQTIWIGPTSDTNWSTSANWAGGSVPTSGNILFTNNGAVLGASNINNIVDASFIALSPSIGLLQYAPTNLGAQHTTFISAGQTLDLSSGLIGGTEADEGANQVQLVGTITGPDGVLNITGGSIIARQGTGTSGNHRGTLDLSGLGTLIAANLTSVSVGVPGLNRPCGTLYLAHTNSITISGSGQALDVGDSASQGNAGSSSSLFLGQTNGIFVNTVGIGRVKNSGSMQFYPGFTNGNPTAYFRASDGASRISLWNEGEATGNSGTTTCTGTADFSGGTVDASVDLMQLGHGGSGGTGTNQSVGNLTLSAGVMDINTLQMGFQAAANAKSGSSTVNVNGTATLVVNTSLEMGHTLGGAGATLCSARLNVNGGTVRAAMISANFASTNNVIALTNGTLILSNANNNASAGPGLRTFSLTNSFLTLQAQGSPSTPMPSLIVTNLNAGGTTNKINIAFIPVQQAYPAQLTLIKYTSFAGLTNLGLGTLPFSFTPYAGFLSNNTANSSVDLVVTAGPAPARSLVWNGQPNGDWGVGSTSTTNWKTNGVATFFNQTDFVLFDDTANGTTTVNLTTQLDPTSLIVSNNNKSYTFNGSGYLDGAVALVKQGSGTLIVDNSSQNTFSGGTVINGGTLQFGNNDFNAQVVPPTGGLVDNATLAFNQQGGVTVPNLISGTGAVTTANGSLTLSAANAFTGAVTVLSGTLIPGNNLALGTTNGPTTVNSGATIDIGSGASTANSLDIRTEPVIVSGVGVSGLGAIVNNGSTAQQNALGNLTLAGDTVFGGSQRWDLRSASGKPASISTGGHSYSITKTNVNQVSLVGVSPIDTNLADINILQGTFAVQTSTSQLGDPTRTITIAPGAILDVYQLSTPLNKNIVVNGDGTTHSIYNENGNSFISGPITLNNSCVIDGTGTTLTLNGAVGGPGSLLKNGLGTLVLNANVSPAGGVSNQVGSLILNGTSSSPLWGLSGTLLAGNGTNAANVQVMGTLNPGPTNAAGTFSAGAGLALQLGSALTFDIGTDNTVIGGAVNDLLQITGDLDATNALVTINAWEGRLQAGTYRLINYTGNFLADPGGAFSSVSGSSATSSRYNFSVDTSTAHQVNLTVTGSAMDLKWAGTSDSSWAPGSGNFADVAPPNNSDSFQNGDTVLLDDSVPGVTNQLTLAPGVAVLPWAITNNSTFNNYIISGAGKISGVASLVKSGTSTLSLMTTNDFAGPITVLAGTLRAGCTNALGSSAAGTTIASGATLDVSSIITNVGANILNLGPEVITVSGAGVGGIGAIINSSTNSQQNALHFVTLAGDTSLGGPGDWSTSTRPGRWDIRNVPTPDVASSSNAVLSTGGHAYNLTKVGSNWLAIVGVQVDSALANIYVNQGLLSIEHASNMGDPAKSLIVTNGAVFEFWQNWPSNLLNKVIVLYGDGTNKPTLVNGAGDNVFIGPITLYSNCLVGVTNSLTLSNNVGNVVSGSGGLTKAGSGPLILWGANTYSGPTTVNAGALSLAGSGSIANSSSIALSSNTVIDVSARSDTTFTLASGQTLSGNGTINGSFTLASGATVSPGVGGLGFIGLLNASNTVTLSGNTVMDIVNGGACDEIRSSDGIAYGGTLTLNFTAGSLSAGQSFKLFDSLVGSYAGSFTISPSSPGPGLRWNTSVLNVSGSLVVSAMPMPGISGITQSGSNLQISATNGLPSTTCYIVASTNVSLALSSWTRIATNSFDVNGHVSFTLPINPAIPSQFYRVQY
jgi:autotransporter-associated beta strand protein